MVDATVDGKPVRFAFDTGASALILFRKKARELGLKVFDSAAAGPPPPGEVRGSRTEPCALTVWNSSFTTSLGVIELPPYLPADMEGVLGWGPLRKNIVRIDAAAQSIQFLDRVPPDAARWTRLRLRPDADILDLELPGPDGKTEILLLDTGSQNGIELPAEKWRAWKAAHAKEPSTLDAYFTPGAGLVVREDAWAKSFALGPLKLIGAPVMKADAMADAGEPYAATLGMAALKRLDVIVDGRAGWAYLRPKTSRPSASAHNRLAAVFVPQGPDGQALLARVVAGGPAFEAGVRDGDELLKIAGLDATRWRTDPKILPLSRFFSRPAGTELDLVLRRGDTTFPAYPILRDILPPARR